jgi:hypothetical protein
LQHFSYVGFINYFCQHFSNSCNIFLEMLEKFLHLPPLTRLRAAAHGVQATFIFHQHPPALATYGVAGAANRSGVRGEL